MTKEEEVTHWSDCAVHSEPAYPAGECDCGGVQPEPVVWHEPGAYGNVTIYEKWAKENGWLPLYTTPQKKEWVGLTDDEVLKEFWNIYPEEDVLFTDVERAFYRAIENKLKAKNT